MADAASNLLEAPLELESPRVVLRPLAPTTPHVGPVLGVVVARLEPLRVVWPSERASEDEDGIGNP